MAELIARRQLLRGIAALPLVSATKSTAEVTGGLSPDARLIALGEALKAAHAHERAVFAANKGDPSLGSERLCDVAYELCSGLADQIEEITAHTFAGIMAKVIAVRWCRDGDGFDSEDLQTTTDERLALGIANDLMALTSF